MRKYPINRSFRNEYSLEHYAIRSIRDACLDADVGDFLMKHDLSTNHLVCLLVSQHFSLARYTDPEYPIL